MSFFDRMAPRRSEKPVQKESGEEEPEQIDAARRGLTRVLGALMGAVAVGAVLPKEALASPASSMGSVAEPDYTSSKEKQNEVDRFIKTTRQSLRKPEVCEALHGGGDVYKNFSTLLRSFEMPILPIHLLNTEYDVRGVYSKSLYFASNITESGGKRRATVQIERTGTKEHARASYPRPEGAGYGNGFYWNDANTIVTAEHVASALFPQSAGYIKNDGRDVSVAIASPEFAATSQDQIIRDDTTVTDTDIEGLLSCVVGIDPDPLSDQDGGKQYPGCPVKMTPEFARQLRGTLPKSDPAGASLEALNDNFERIIANSYMIVLPAGEAKAYPNASTQMPAMGMSGSPVWGYIPQKGYRCIGILSIAGVIPDFATKRCVDVAFFQPLSVIRQTVANASRWKLSNG